MEQMIGKTIAAIDGCEKGSQEVTFSFTDNTKCVLYHEQDCCESVLVEEIHGNPAQMVGHTIKKAAVSTATPPQEFNYECAEWTFYKIACMGDYLTIRWLGESNGYYGVEVSTKWL